MQCMYNTLEYKRYTTIILEYITLHLWVQVSIIQTIKNLTLSWLAFFLLNMGWGGAPPSNSVILSCTQVSYMIIV